MISTTPGRESRETIDLRTAAAELDVHYQTAYRWVRSGRLDAQRIGGRYVVDRAAIVALQHERAAPEPPAPPSASRLDRSGERLHRLLLDGDEAGARHLTRQLLGDGATAVELIERAVAPALAAIGRAWHDGELPIWVEHRATAIVERILGDVVPNPRGRRRGTVVVAAIAGDRHSMPTTMAAIALREDHWHVHHLGADIPVTEIVDFCAGHDVDTVVLSSTNPVTHDAALESQDVLRSAGVTAIVGGPGHTLSDLLDRVRSTVG